MSPLGDVELILKLFEVRVLAGVQYLSKIWSQKDRCLHWCRHEHSPKYFLLCAWIPGDGASFARFTFFFMFLKTFSKYPESEICILWNSSFRLVFEVWESICCLSWEYTVGPSSVAHADCFQLLEHHPDPNFDSLGLFGSLSSCGRILPVLPLPIPQSGCFPELSLTWRPDRIRKKFAEMAARRKSRNSWYSTNEEDGSTHHEWNFLRSTCHRVVFWCQRIWSESWFPNWFCQTSALNDHFDHCFSVFKDVQLRLALRRICV